MKQLIFILSLINCFSLFAGDPVGEKLRQAGDASDYPNSNLLIVFDSIRTDVMASGLTYVVNHTLFKALTAEGAKELNALIVGYDPQSAFVEIRNVTVYRKEGDIQPLDTSRVMDYPAPARAIYWGAREKMIEIGRLEPGDAVDMITFRKGFTYALLADDDEKYIPPMRGHFYDIVEFFNPNPVLCKVYQVSVPVEKTLQFEFYNGEAQVSAWLHGDKYVYTFTRKDIMPVKSEPRMVAQSDIGPKLLLSTSPDWYAKSTWFFGVNEEFGSFESAPEIKAKVDEILAGAKDETDSISKLTHWCADEIRYSGISMGEGEGFTLHKGIMTFTDRCGVCKDKAGMLITLLRAAGFESYPAMTMAGSRIDYIPADQFNHCVTVVKRHDGSYQLLDPTWVPFLRELWSSAEQQQQYLMGVPESADLATTPVSDPGNHYVKITCGSVLRSDGTLQGSVSITAEGQSDAAVRSFFKYSNKTQWERNIEREFLRIHPKARIISVDYGDPMDYMAGPVHIDVEFIIPAYARVYGNTVFFTPLLPARLYKLAQGQLYFSTDPAERKYPFRDRCSRRVEIYERTELPPVKSIIRLPLQFTAEGKSASLKYTYTLENNILEFSETSVFAKRIYEPEEWPEFRAVIEAQNKVSAEPVIIELNQ